MWPARSFPTPFEFYIDRMMITRLAPVAIALISPLVLPAARRGALIDIDLIAVRGDKTVSFLRCAYLRH